jgi:hypothetical protein
VGASATYSFESECWEWHARASWYFVSLPVGVADDIDDRFGHRAAGFGSIRVEVTVGDSTWQTSVFPDAGRGTLVLPLKKDVRRREGIGVGDSVKVALSVVLD